METNRSLPVKTRTGFFSHGECMEEEYEYANELVKQGEKNPRKVPKCTSVLAKENIDAHAIWADHPINTEYQVATDQVI